MKLREFIEYSNIPEKFRKYKEVGSGIDSLVLDYSKEHVLLFSRDKGKVAWLVESGIAEVIDKFSDLDRTSFHSVNKKTIYMLLVIKLNPVKSYDNKKFDKFFEFVKENLRLNHYDSATDKMTFTRDNKYFVRKTNKINKFSFRYKSLLKKLLSKFDIEFITPDHLEKFVEFLMKHGGAGHADSVFAMDLHYGNIMTTNDGKYVLTDPFVSFANKDAYKKLPSPPVTREIYIENSEDWPRWNAVSERDLPEKYSKYRVYARGSTSYISQSDNPNTVLVFTRDKPKVHWLLYSGLGEIIDKFTSDNPKFGKLPIYVLEVEKLQQLSERNHKKLFDMATFIKNTFVGDDGRFLFSKEKVSRLGNIMKSNKLKLVMKKLYDKKQIDFVNEKSFIKFSEFLIDNIEDIHKFFYDIGSSNVMEDRDGNIVVLDPVFSKEIDVIMNGDPTGDNNSMRSPQ